MIRLVLVAGDSMAPTYRSSDLLLTRPARWARVSASRGDVVVFRRGAQLMVKRIVGMPDDVVELEAGRLFVNGLSVEGRRRVRGAHTRLWRVPAEHYFMAGDNRSASEDSRVWAQPFVPAESIDATVMRRLVGLGRSGGFMPRRRLAAAGRVA